MRLLCACGGRICPVNSSGGCGPHAAVIDKPAKEMTMTEPEERTGMYDFIDAVEAAIKAIGRGSMDGGTQPLARNAFRDNELATSPKLT